VGVREGAALVVLAAAAAAAAADCAVCSSYMDADMLPLITATQRCR